MAQGGPSGDSPVYTARRQAFEKEQPRISRQSSPRCATAGRSPRRRSPIPAGATASGGSGAASAASRSSSSSRGDLAAWRSNNFERVYDLPERVIPAAVLAAPTPAVDEAQRRLAGRAASALGVATLRDLANYYVLKPRVGAAAREGARRIGRARRGGGRRDGKTRATQSRRAARTAASRPRDVVVAVRLAHLGAEPDPAVVRLRLQDRGLRARGRTQARLLRAAVVARRRAGRALRPQGRSGRRRSCACAARSRKPASIDLSWAPPRPSSSTPCASGSASTASRSRARRPRRGRQIAIRSAHAERHVPESCQRAAPRRCSRSASGTWAGRPDRCPWSSSRPPAARRGNCARSCSRRRCRRARRS